MSQTKNQESTDNVPRTTKPGRTLLVKPTNTNFDASVFATLTGYTSTYHTEKSNTYFITFSTPDQANKAMSELKDVRSKFAHYRVFFKMEGLTNSVDYNTFKSAHSDLITKNTNSSVLYYKLYRKNDAYIGCGDFTVDTKECFDALLNGDGLKNFTVDGLSGVHFRYKKTDTTPQPPRHKNHQRKPKA